MPSRGARLGEDGSKVAVFEAKQTVGRFVVNFARRGPTACFRGTSALWKNRQSVGARNRKVSQTVDGDSTLLGLSLRATAVMITDFL